MITAVVNTLVYLEPEPLIDSSGEPVTTKVNVDWTKSAKLRGTATTVTPTITHDADGDYDISATFSAIGVWYVKYSVVVDGVTRRFAQTVHIITAAQADPAAALESATITVVSPISLTGDISLIAGDAASIPWTSSEWDDLTSATVTFQAYKLITDEAVFADAKSVTKSSVGGASQTVTLALLSTDTDDFTPGIAYRYELDSTVGTLASGKLSARGS